MNYSIPVLAIIGVLLWLHRRNIKKQRQEDQNDPHKSLDFGLEDKPKATSNLRRSIFGEKGMSHKQQLSMDMDMSTPYLLPPQLHESRESLHSLAHSVQNPEDPYRPVEYTASDVGSMREARRGPGGDQASLYTTSTRSGAPRGVRSPSGMSFPAATASGRGSVPAPSHARLTTLAHLTLGLAPHLAHRAQARPVHVSVRD